MAEPKVNQNDASTEPKGSTDSASSTESTTDYILLDQVFTKQVGKRGKKYKKGARVPLTEAEAVTLLAGPRPSVREVTEEDNK
jgi:hypothetical protein